MHIRDSLKSLKKDNVRIAILIVTILLCGYHIFEFLEIDNVVCLFRVGVYAILSLIIMFYNLKVMYVTLIIIALVASYFNHFLNFTSFFVLLLACRMYRKSETMLLVIYGINCSIAMFFQGRDIMDLLSHIGTCTFFYLIYFFLNRPKTLELKPDEEAIIQELAEGKLQKEITLYSKNIIKDKLDHAKDRNHIISTDELVTLYRQSHTQSHP